MKIKAKVKLNDAVIKQLIKASEDCMEPFMETFSMLIQHAQVVPKAQGDLALSEYIMGDKGKWFIGWNTPYARYHFYGLSRQSGYTKRMNYRKDKNANAQSRWTDPFIYGDEKDTLIKAYAAHWKRGAGGIIK